MFLEKPRYEEKEDGFYCHQNEHIIRAHFLSRKQRFYKRIEHFLKREQASQAVCNESKE